MKSIKQLLVLAGLLSTCLIASTSHADTYPSKPITLIVPWNPGGSVDLTGRQLSDIMGKQGYRVVVENLPGASSTIGLSKVARAKPDGYTIGIATSSLMGVVAQGMTDLKVDDFTALNQTTLEQLILVVPAASPANSIEEFVKIMKEKKDGVSIGTPGSNNVNHTFAAMLSKAVGTEYTNVPYTGGSKVLVDLAGNQIDAAVLKPSETLSMIQAGQIRPIGVFSKKRVEILPKVPTFAEKDIDVFPYGTLEQMSYLVGPKGIPEDIAVKIQEVFGETLQGSAYKQFAAKYGMMVTDLQGAKLQAEAQDIQKTFNTVAPKIFTKQ